MAIKMTNIEWCSCTNDYRKEFMMDTDADMANLPKCCVGSTAIAVSSGEVYMVNASGDWVVFGAEG